MANITHITAESFDATIDSPTPVLVDFWAEWCGPCRMIAPILEQLAGELGDSLRIVKLNVDEYPEMAVRFGVQGIPTLILFKDGQPVDELVGFMQKARLLQRLQPHLDTAVGAA